MKTSFFKRHFISYLIALFIGIFSIQALQAADISNPVNVGDLSTNANIGDNWLDLNLFPADADERPPSDIERVNWKVATMADDDVNLFIYYENYQNMNPNIISGRNLSFEWGWQIFLDTDDSAETGFKLSNVVGADYIVEGNILMKYEGSGSNWNWSTIGPLESSYYDNKIAYKVPRLSLNNPQRIKAVFQGSNEAFGGTSTDLYPDGAYEETATTRYFSYVLADSISIGSNNPPVLLDQTFIIPKNRAERGFNLHGTDADNHILTYDILSEPQNGSFYFKRFGDMYYVIFYAPNQGFVGQDIFTYKASDSIDESRVATITFDVVEDNSQNSYSNEVEDDSIKVDAKLTDWSTLTPFPDRSTINAYEPANGPSWLNAGIAHSDNNLYLSYRNRNAIVVDETSGTYIPWQYQTFLDTDQNRYTGYLLNDGTGAEYMIEGNYLYFYNGNGYDWNWQEISALEASFVGNNAEISIPRNLINFNQSSFNIFFYGNTGSQLAVNYPVTNSHYFVYSIGAGISGSEMNISNNQQGLSRSPSEHQPILSSSTPDSTSNSSGGGLIDYWLMVFVSSLLVFRRKRTF